MPCAGALCAPCVIPLGKCVGAQPFCHIDTSTYIEMCTESKDCRLFFTTDGSRPAPFNRKMFGKEVTFRYIAPFTLKAGRRVINAVAVNRDGTKMSDVVTRTFQVDDIGPLQLGMIAKPNYHNERNVNQSNTRELTETSLPKKRPRGAWDSSQKSASSSKASEDNVGSFISTNYSGTQINLYSGDSAGQGISVSPSGQVTLGHSQTLSPPYNTQYGYLTQQMIENCNQNKQPVTVADIRSVLQETIAQQVEALQSRPEPIPSIEYPSYKDPPLNDVSQGNGDWKEQLLHIYAQLLDYTRKNDDFKFKVSQPKLGKVKSAEFHDDGDVYRIEFTISKPGVQSSAVVTKPAKKPNKTVEPKVDSGINKVKSATSTKPKPDPYHEMETENLNHKGTLHPYPNFNASLDCEILHGAMKGLGTDENTLINVMAYRTSGQRVEIADTYKSHYGKELSKEFSSELSGNFLTVMKGLCLSPAAYDASCLREAIKGLGTDEDVLIEILCTRSNSQVKELIKVYKELFKTDLTKDVASDTSSNFKRLLISLLQASRSDSLKVDRNRARQDARTLYEAGEKKLGTDESKFNYILVTRSYPQLRATFEEYKKISKKDIEEALKSEMSGDLLRGLLTIVRCIKHKTSHFARQLQKSMKGIGTDDDHIVRVILSRCELDMVQIKEEFSKLTGQTLEQFITNDTSGDYRKVLLALVTGGSPPDVAATSGKAFVTATRAKTTQQLDEEVKLQNEKIEADPTVVPADGFDAGSDADALRKAMKGLGTDEAAIIRILPYRSNSQRLQIAETFNRKFGKDLIKELKSELSGGFEKLSTQLCLSPADFDATMIKKAVQYLGTDDTALIEIICTRTNQQIIDFKKSYTKLFGKKVEDDVASDTSGDYQKLLLTLLQAKRPEENTFDRALATRDAEQMYKDGENKTFGTVESTFSTILGTKSYSQLRATFQEYAKISKNDIEDALKKEMSANILECYLSIVRCIRNKAAHFAKELHDAMEGMGTDDDRLIRIVVSRCEIDMVQVKDEFQKRYKQTLGQFIHDDTSGDYRKMLLALIRDENVK